MSRIGIKQIGILHKLGYRETEEDGALCEHPTMRGIDKFVWHDEYFMDVIEKYEERIKRGLAQEIACLILSERG